MNTTAHFKGFALNEKGEEDVYVLTFHIPKAKVTAEVLESMHTLQGHGVSLSAVSVEQEDYDKAMQRKLFLENGPAEIEDYLRREVIEPLIGQQEQPGEPAPPPVEGDSFGDEGLAPFHAPGWDVVRTSYLDTDGIPIFVDCGISSGKEWGSFKRKANGSLKRVVSKVMPMVEDRKIAQSNLDKWAKTHELVAVDATKANEVLADAGDLAAEAIPEAEPESIPTIPPPLSDYIRVGDKIVRKESAITEKLDRKPHVVTAVMFGQVETDVGRVGLASLNDKYRLVLDEKSVSVGDVFLRGPDDPATPICVATKNEDGVTYRVLGHKATQALLWSLVDRDWTMLIRQPGVGPQEEATDGTDLR